MNIFRIKDSTIIYWRINRANNLKKNRPKLIENSKLSIGSGNVEIIDFLKYYFVYNDSLLEHHQIDKMIIFCALENTLKL